MIRLSKYNAGFLSAHGVYGENSPHWLVGQKSNDPVVVRGEMGEATPHSENAMPKDAWNIVGRVP